MNGLLKIFEGVSAGIVAAMTAIITGLLCLIGFTLWNGLWDNPAVADAARAEYVKLSVLEAAKAKAKTAEDLLKLANQKNSELTNQLAGYEAADAQFAKSQQISAKLKKEQDDELAQVEAARSGDGIPDLGELGIFDRLRNR